jgi:hypothetical protein
MFQDWLEYSSVPGVCPAVASCDATIAASTIPCVPQPITDNGSCAEIVTQCQFWVTQGLFQNEYCVLASFCYAWSNTDVLLKREYPSYISPTPSTSQQARLSEAVFYNMTGGAASMTQQNAIDAYYAGLVCCSLSRSINLTSFHINRQAHGCSTVDLSVQRRLRKLITMGLILPRELSRDLQRI